LNDDGLAAEERQRLKDEKESAKIKRQVEADLGGFDIEGAPPIPKRVYSVWVVDAATGWNVVDSHELGEFEHATTMQVMTLTEVSILFFVIFEDCWSNLIKICCYNAVYGRAGKL
jgi:cleavage and polyadenylation specificity factor subunit 1